MDEVFPGATMKEIPWRKLAGQWENALPSGAARWLQSGALDNALPVGVDFLWQLGQDWSNPRLPLERKILRAGVSGGVGALGGGATWLAAGLIFGFEATPPGLV